MGASEKGIEGKPTPDHSRPGGSTFVDKPVCVIRASVRTVLPRLGGGDTDGDVLRAIYLLYISDTTGPHLLRVAFWRGFDSYWGRIVLP